MTMDLLRVRAVLAHIERFEPPSDAAGARRLARQMNERSRQERARREAARRGLLDRTQLRPTAARARIDSREIYRERNWPRAERDPEEPPAPMPRRPRSFGELARQFYGPPSADGLIPAGSRGGAR